MAVHNRLQYQCYQRKTPCFNPFVQVFGKQWEVDNKVSPLYQVDHRRNCDLQMNRDEKKLRRQTQCLAFSQKLRTVVRPRIARDNSRTSLAKNGALSDKRRTSERKVAYRRIICSGNWPKRTDLAFARIGCLENLGRETVNAQSHYQSEQAWISENVTFPILEGKILHFELNQLLLTICANGCK